MSNYFNCSLEYYLHWCRDNTEHGIIDYAESVGIDHPDEFDDFRDKIIDELSRLEQKDFIFLLKEILSESSNKMVLNNNFYLVRELLSYYPREKSFPKEELGETIDKVLEYKVVKKNSFLHTNFKILKHTYVNNGGAIEDWSKF